MENSLTITGTLGGDPVQRTTRGGDLTVFSIAHTPRIRTDDGWTDGVTSWFEVTAWGQLGRHVLGSLRKGQRAIVHGTVSVDEWELKDGGRGRKAQIRATAIGHDLTFGTTAFTRSGARRAAVDEPRATPEESAPDAPDAPRPEREPAVVGAADGGWNTSLGADDGTPF